MVQSPGTDSGLSNLAPDNKSRATMDQKTDSSAQLQSPGQQSLFGRARENLNFTKYLQFTSGQSTASAASAEAPVSASDTQDGSKAGGSEAVASQQKSPSDLTEAHGKQPDADFDRPLASQTQKPNSDDVLRAEDTSWSKWAAANAARARETVASNATFVRDVAASKLPGGGGFTPSDTNNQTDLATADKKSYAQSLLDTGAGLKGSVASKLGYATDHTSKRAADTNFSVQDVVDRHSTTTRTAEVGQKSVTQGLIDIGLGLKDEIASHIGYGPNPDTPAATRVAILKEQAGTRAATLKQSTIAAISPGKEDIDLSQAITDCLNNLPSLLKEKVWRSSTLETAPNVDDLPVSASPEPGSVNSSAAPAGIVKRMSGAVSSASGVVSSYLPTSYLPSAVTSYFHHEQGSSQNIEQKDSTSGSEIANPAEAVTDENRTPSKALSEN